MKKINIHTEATIRAEGRLNSRHCKPVVCVAVDGSEFRSFSSVDDAARELGIHPGYLSTCMSNNRPCKGYKFCGTKDIASIVGEMAAVINNNAADAKQYRRIKAEEEKRIEDERKAREQHTAAIAKAEAKITKYATAAEKYQVMYNEALSELDKANRELEALLDEE